MPKVKAITLYQPWASLLVIGAKRFETRSWKTLHLGTLAIHAGLNLSYRHLALDEPFRSVFEDAGLNPDDLPFGAVIGWVHHSGCFPVGSVIHHIDAQEHAFGDFSPGRFAWFMKYSWRFPSVFPTSGKQGLWTWDAPLGWSREGIATRSPENDTGWLPTA